MSPCVLQRISLSVLRRVLQKASVKKTTPASVGHFMKEMVLPVKVNIVWGWRHHLWWQHICICISPSWTVSLSPVVKFVSLSLSEWWTSFYVSVMSFRHAPSGGQTVRVYHFLLYWWEFVVSVSLPPVADMCQFWNGGCAKVARCSQKGEKVVCTCPRGYSGDGFTCLPIDPCTSGVNGGCHEHATCTMVAPVRMTQKTLWWVGTLSSHLSKTKKKMWHVCVDRERKGARVKTATLVTVWRVKSNSCQSVVVSRTMENVTWTLNVQICTLKVKFVNVSK